MFLCKLENDIFLREIDEWASDLSIILDEDAN